MGRHSFFSTGVISAKLFRCSSTKVTEDKTGDNTRSRKYTRDISKGVLMNRKTEPPHELLLAQLILSSVIIGLVSHATYVKEGTIPKYTLQFKEGKNIFKFSGTKRIPLNEFQVAHKILFLFIVSSAYFFANFLLYLTNKIMREPILNGTILMLMQDVVFCFLMFACSITAMAHSGYNATMYREIEILIAAGISLFCSMSSGIGVYYSYRVYKGL